MHLTVTNRNESLVVSIEITPQSLAFISQERFKEIMPAIQEIRDIPNKREVYEKYGSFEISPMEFTKFILPFIKSSLTKLKGEYD